MPDYKNFHELSLNVLDIAQNSIKANASLIKISVLINTAVDTLTVTVDDNGDGFDTRQYQKMLQEGKYPRENKGLGLLLFKESTEAAEGKLEISSKIGIGTSVKAMYILSSPNRTPLGDINETIKTLILCCKNIRIVYIYEVDGQGFTLDTEQIKEIMGEISLDSPEVMGFIGEYLNEKTDYINKNRIF